MRRLAVFDIDGTLTETNAVDDECYLRAVGDILNLDPAALDWTDAPHITDAALLDWLAERNDRTPVNDATRQAVIDRFLEHLENASRTSRHRFRAVAGACEVFAELRQGGWHIAIATGGWERSARFKLKLAGLDVSEVPLASATDAPTRTEIMELAVRRASFDNFPFERIVSIADGTWDVRAATELDWPFVGIASGDRAAELRRLGATTILPNFADTMMFCAALDAAEVPHP